MVLAVIYASSYDSAKSCVNMSFSLQMQLNLHKVPTLLEIQISITCGVKSGFCLMQIPQIYIPLCLALTLSLLAVNFEDCSSMTLQTIWIQMKPHKMWGFIWDPNCLTFRLYISKKNGWKQCFFYKILKETNIWKNYLACELDAALNSTETSICILILVALNWIMLNADT